MKFRIIEERLYNEFGFNFETKFMAKEQCSFLGIKYWSYLEDAESDYDETYYTKWEFPDIEDLEIKLNNYIDVQVENRRTKSVKIERMIIKEITR